MKQLFKAGGLVLLVLLIDQSLKIWVKTHLNYGDEIKIFGLDWALIHFVENNGMAFGLSLGGAYGKLALSLFRILAIGLLLLFIRQLQREGAPFGLIASFALILAGATGNMIDSAFYGLIFSASPYHGGLAELFPAQGYAGFLHGQVVDMLYFPVLQGVYPDWLPWLGGKTYFFFKPVFNIADVSITVGVIQILFFQRHYFAQSPGEAATSSAPALASEDTPPSVEGKSTNEEGG